MLRSSEQSAYSSDEANRLTGISHQTTGGTVVSSYTYTLDAANRVTQLARTWTVSGGPTSDTASYSYTDNGQLTGVTHTNSSFASESFSYDANGNRNSTGYSTGTGNELTTDGTYNYAYDNEGNLISETDIATGDKTLYAYDFRNRLTEVDEVVDGVTTVLATYTYDALDRRIGVSEGGATTWTAYDGSNPLLDFNGAGTLMSRHLSGPSPTGVDAVLARDTPSGGVTWYLSDAPGSVNDLVDNSGAVLDHIDYRAFGRIVDESNPSAGDRFKYAGLQYDAVTGLNVAMNRVQEPATGRWLTEDPLRFAGGDVNLYRYVDNSVVSMADPSGLQVPVYRPPVHRPPPPLVPNGPSPFEDPTFPYSPMTPPDGAPFGGPRTRPNVNLPTPPDGYHWEWKTFYYWQCVGRRCLFRRRVAVRRPVLVPNGPPPSPKPPYRGPGMLVPARPS